jgi:hypothetical protein
VSCGAIGSIGIRAQTGSCQFPRHLAGYKKLSAARNCPDVRCPSLAGALVPRHKRGRALLPVNRLVTRGLDRTKLCRLGAATPRGLFKGRLHNALDRTKLCRCQARYRPRCRVSSPPRSTSRATCSSARERARDAGPLSTGPCLAASRNFATAPALEQGTCRRWRRPRCGCDCRIAAASVFQRPRFRAGSSA